MPDVRVAVLSSPPSPLPASIAAALAGADHVVLAGGIPSGHVLDALRAVAPLTAVVGHRDYLAFGRHLPESAELQIAGARLLVLPLAGVLPDLLPPVRERLEDDPPDAVLHGDGAAADVRWLAGTLFVCPGHARRGTPGRTPTCALLDVEGPGRITARIVEVP